MEIIDFFLDIFNHPYENSFINFLSGAIFIFCIYNFLIYFQQHVLAYLYYSLYLFFLFVSIAPFGNGFLKTSANVMGPALKYSVPFAAEMAFPVYFLFALSFLNLKEKNLKWYRIILYGTFFYTGVVVLAYLSFFSGNEHSLSIGYEVTMIYLAPILTFISYWPVVKLETPLKYYIIIGSFLVIMSSVITDAMAFYSGQDRLELSIYYSVFFTCIIAEISLFSLGLGHKHKKIMDENHSSQEKIIAQYRENEILKETVRQKLEENLRLKSEEAEGERLEKIKANYEKELAEMKVSALKSQMNPHFIFNSLNSIKLYIIDNEKDQAVYYLNKFSKLIRKILSSTREKTISLSEELEIMKIYVSIENIRFRDDIDFEIIVPTELNTDTVQLPPMILQPFIENSIWHGLPSKKGKKRIRLILSTCEDWLRITIEDNGIGRIRAHELKKMKVHKNKAVGINLIRERLKIFSREKPHDHSIKIIDLYNEQGEPKGTKVLLQIPLKQNFSLT